MGATLVLGNWQAQIFRRPVPQEQQTDDDARDTQHTWGDHPTRKLSIAGITISPMNALRLCHPPLTDHSRERKALTAKTSVPELVCEEIISAV
jgi:hypothetical protein